LLTPFTQPFARRRKLRLLILVVIAGVGSPLWGAAQDQLILRSITAIKDSGKDPASMSFTDRSASTAISWEGAPQDWSSANSVMVTVANPDAFPVGVTLRVEDQRRQGLEGDVVVPPASQASLLLPFYLPAAGILAMPPVSKAGDPFIPSDVHGSINTGLVTTFRVQARDRSHLLWIGTPTLFNDDWRRRLSGVSDAFGQYVGAQWPEKVNDDRSLQEHLAAALAAVEQFESTSPTPHPFGSLLVPNGLRPSGFFRAERRYGRWWLVTPDGHGFFSLGVNAVRAESRTPVTNRTFMFTALPQPGTTEARFLNPSVQAPETWDVEGTNLERGLGPAWRDAWPRRTVRRLEAWGFNTIGNWSDATVTSLGQMPYVTTLQIGSNPADILVNERQPIADPFDPAFSQAADAAARAASEGLRDDSMLIGYFGANELPWRGVGRSVLALPHPSAARTMLIDRLRAEYEDARLLAAAWNMPDLVGWQQMNVPLSLPNPASAKAEADLSAFEAVFADRWFQIVSEAIKRYDPNHLFLGARFAEWTPEAVRACAQWCDVLSFNIYARSPSPSTATALWRALDKPVLIGEFHFGSTDRGNFWPGVVDVAAEEARAPAYTAYLNAAVDDPNIVGCHWFAYADEPLTGRIGDGENGHIGLVAITDVPWTSFTESVTSANRAAIIRLLHQ
jgi:hypothetical protein